MNEKQPTAGERGCVITPMSPSGKVLIDGVQYSARLKSDFADSGDEVVVVGLDAFGFIVEKRDSVAQALQKPPDPSSAPTRPDAKLGILDSRKSSLSG